MKRDLKNKSNRTADDVTGFCDILGTLMRTLPQKDRLDTQIFILEHIYILKYELQ